MKKTNFILLFLFSSFLSYAGKKQLLDTIRCKKLIYDSVLKVTIDSCTKQKCNGVFVNNYYYNYGILIYEIYKNGKLSKELAYRREYNNSKPYLSNVIFFNNGIDIKNYEFDKNGKLKSRIKHLNNSLKIYKTYYENGKLKSKFYEQKSKKYKNYWILYGKRVEFYDDGNIKKKCYYKDDKLTKKYFEYNGNKKVILILEYDNGKLMNVLKYSDWVGNPLKYGTLKNGNGTLFEYDEYSLQAPAFYKDWDTNNLIYKYKITHINEYKNGRIYKSISTNSLCVDSVIDNDKMFSIQYYYNDNKNKKIKSKSIYKYKIYDERFIDDLNQKEFYESYYENGNIEYKVIYNFNNNKNQRKHLFFDIDGNLISDKFYINNELIETKEYSPLIE